MSKDAFLCATKLTLFGVRYLRLHVGGRAKGPSMTGLNGNELMAAVGKKEIPELFVVPRVGDQQKG